MDTLQQIVNLIVLFAQANPHAAVAVGGLSALYAGVQGLGLALSKLFPSHTKAARIGAAVAAFPIKITPPAPRDPVLDAQGQG